MPGRSRSIAMVVLAAALAGCGVRPITGGTKGVLRVDGKFVSDLQVTVHQLAGGSLHAVGFGVTANDGSFRLVKNNATGPLWLTPGDYRITVESVGAPIRIANEYARADATPLKVSWSARDDRLNLDVSNSPERAVQALDHRSATALKPSVGDNGEDPIG